LKADGHGSEIWIPDEAPDKTAAAITIMLAVLHASQISRAQSQPEAHQHWFAAIFPIVVKSLHARMAQVGHLWGQLVKAMAQSV
jgi:hypothetical protein